MSRGVKFPIVVAFRVTDEERRELDEAVRDWWAQKGYGYSSGNRAAWLRKLVLAAVRGEELPLPGDRCKRAIAIATSGKHGSSDVNAAGAVNGDPAAAPSRKRAAGPRGFLKKAFPKKRKGSK